MESQTQVWAMALALCELKRYEPVAALREYSLMFRSTVPAAFVAATLLAAAMLLPSTGYGQTDTPAAPQQSTEAPAAQPAPAAPPSAPQTALPPGRRRHMSRQTRIQRNIQDAYSHKYEIAGGGGFLRFRTGEYLQHITEANFFMDGTRMFTPKWGALVGVRGMFGNANIPNEDAHNFIFRPQISEYTFMAGVQRRFVQKEKWTVSGQVTGGIALSKFAGDAKGLRSTDLGMWPDSNARPAFQAAVSFDYNFYNNFAFRFEPTYVATTFGGTVQNNKGINFGVVYRFGRQ